MSRRHCDEDEKEISLSECGFISLSGEIIYINRKCHSKQPETMTSIYMAGRLHSQRKKNEKSAIIIVNPLSLVISHLDIEVVKTITACFMAENDYLKLEPKTKPFFSSFG